MNNINIAVVGLGYVGLELAIGLSEHFPVIGFDNNPKRIQALEQSEDINFQCSTRQLANSKLQLCASSEKIKHSNVYIITVPTPVYYYEFPDLEPLESASREVGGVLKKGDIVIYESSVYPGTTTNICIPILESVSKLKENRDFFVGYSPERLSPSDTEHSLKNVTKLISASNDKTLATMKHIYQKVCPSIYTVSKIEYAEASKILENTQRDVNIALMNEFTKIMHAMNLDMSQVLKAAETKFNFIPFKPGLVGGHCISIDPMYMAFQAKRFSVGPDLILCARKVNDSITQFILQEMLKNLMLHTTHPGPYKIGIFGVTYKANIPDTRNSLVFKFIKECKEFPLQLMIHDPYYQHVILKQTGDAPINAFDEIQQLDMAIIFVDHDFYKQQGLKTFIQKCVKPTQIMDIPGMFANEVDTKKLNYWRL